MAQNSKYQEDITTLAAGTELFGGPVVIRTLTITADTADSTIVNFSDSATTYNSTYRVFKVAIAGPLTKHFVFPEGKSFTRGLCATANNGSVDVSVTYD